MTSQHCPDWADLARRREQAELGPEVGALAIDAAWRDALRHRESCPSCRAASVAVDPLFLFSGPLGSDGAASGRATSDRADDCEASLAADEVRRRVRLELDARARAKRLGRGRNVRRRRAVASVLAAGVAAAALGVSFLLWPGASPQAGVDGRIDGNLDSRNAALVPGDLPDHVAMAPLVEPLGDEPIQVYQLPGAGSGLGLDVVLVVSP